MYTIYVFKRESLKRMILKEKKSGCKGNIFARNINISGNNKNVDKL